MLTFNGRTRHTIACVLLALGVVAGQLFMTPTDAVAHTEEQMAAIVGDHGGQVRAAGNHHLELTTGAGELHVWITDHGNTPEDASKSSGSATLFIGEQRVTVPLTPAGKNELRGSNPNIRSNDLRVILNVTVPGEDPLQARYQFNKQHAH